MPFLSIITISLKVDSLLEGTLISIDQALSEYIKNGAVESLVIAGDSSRPSWLTQYPSVVLYSKPTGVYPAMNVGIEAAKGEWIWFVNAGDFCLHDQASMLVEFLKSAEVVGCDLLMCGVKLIKNRANIEDGQICFGRLTSPHQGTIYRKSTVEALGCFDTSYRVISDRLLFDLFRFKNKKIKRTTFLISTFVADGLSSGVSGKAIIDKETRRNFWENRFNLLSFYRYLRTFL